MNKIRNTPSPAGSPSSQSAAERAGAELGIEPMTARSVVLSALLGTHPPTLPGSALTALAALFDIREGTVRTALSRSVRSGELETSDGRYRLAGRMLTRQREQDTGQVAPGAEWDGLWYTVVAVADSRSMAERRAFRHEMVGARLAELRPDIWMRPANVVLDIDDAGVLALHGTLHVADVADLAGRLWPLGEIEAQARRLHDALVRQRSAIQSGDVELLPTTFTIAAAVVRFLRTEPQLPTPLAPTDWTPPLVRSLYDEFVTDFQQQLQAFFASLES